MRNTEMVGDESSTGSGGGFRSLLHYFLYNGKKKHVFAGIAIISVVFVVPLYFMTIEKRKKVKSTELLRCVQVSVERRENQSESGTNPE
ncbi:hypothetical protein KSP39_PZI004456 [Platanthera zijinensis]|uniref:Uncharacterized protein n=1 Tax=Platanthera zijinensis TaxID=2320716 RepID=A0AAP0BYG9_9ASPA